MLLMWYEMIYHHLEDSTLRIGTPESRGGSERKVDHKEKSLSCVKHKQVK